MTYYVTYKIEGRWTTDVEASSVEEAKEKAQCYLEAADLNRMEFIDTCPIIVEDDKDIVWEA